jgi:hypothetical protein
MLNLLNLINVILRLSKDQHDDEHELQINYLGRTIQTTAGISDVILNSH